MKNIFFIFIFALILFSCRGIGNKSTENMVKNDTVTELNSVSVKLEPLKDENLKLKGKDIFGNVIELKGEQIVIDTPIFKPLGPKMIIKNNLLIMENRNNEGYFTLFELPDLRLIKQFGKIGQGPDEFMSPSMARNTNPDIPATVVEETTGKIYDVLPDGTLRPYDINLRKPESLQDYIAYQAVLMTESILYFVSNSPTGKSFFTLDMDSVQMNELQNLALDPKRKGWANYIGYSAVNMEQTRMVYAYQYFKILKFFDLEHNTIRTINFEREEADENTIYRINGLDASVSHYFGICATDKYIYAMSVGGRTAHQVWTDNHKKGIHYIYVEQYDWNGNPIAQYKLDQSGWIVVDENTNTLYLVSSNHDDPFFKYRL